MKIKLSEILQDTKTVAISGHIRPDGDCVGSCMGMYLYLKKALPDAQIDGYLEKPADIFYSRNFRMFSQRSIWKKSVILLSFWKEATGSYIPVRKRKYTICSLHWMPGTSSVSERLQNILTLQNARSALTTISATQAMHRPIISKQRQVLPVN